MAKWNAPSPPTVAVVPADHSDEKSETKGEETHLLNGTDKVFIIFVFCTPNFFFLHKYKITQKKKFMTN